jgi:hypothetical protein
MKRTKTNSLRLSKETLRSLSKSELDGAAGGGADTATGAVCCGPTYTCSCDTMCRTKCFACLYFYGGGLLVKG